jgi:LysR family transcriptional regulator for metE and metH
LATECYTAYHWLPPVLREFQDRWPKVELRIAPEHTESPITAIRQGALDLGIVYHRISDNRIRLEPLFDDEMVVVTSPDHPFARAEHVAIGAIANEHLFTYRSLASSSSVIRDILESGDVQPMKTTQLQLTEGILELVAAGFGVAILARWAVAPAVRAGTVHATRLGKKGYPRRWYAAVRASDVTPAYQFDLIEMLRRHLTVGPTVRIDPQLRLS